MESQLSLISIIHGSSLIDLPIRISFRTGCNSAGGKLKNGINSRSHSERFILYM